jgi:hypothetical protein
MQQDFAVAGFFPWPVFRGVVAATGRLRCGRSPAGITADPGLLNR